MYIASFGLAEKPFAITPDPRYLYLGRQHADALAHLVYGINDAGGFIQLTGEVGTGKTTTIRSLLARSPNNADIALIINPRLSPVEFLQAICEELGVEVPNSAVGNGKMLVDLLNRKLLRIHAEGRRAVLIVDEAQNLTAEVLEQVRLLTNLETDSQKLLQIILIGQPELRDLLNRNDLRQLAQRVTARCHLQPLARDDTFAYVRHRLRVAGATSDIFTNSALAEVHRRSRGIPRVINVICDRALLGAYTEDRHEVDAALVRRAAGEVYGRTLAPAWLLPLSVAGVVALLVVGAGVALHYAPLPRLDFSTGKEVAHTATASAPIARPKPAPTLGETLAVDAKATTADAAFAALFTLWGATYAPGPTDPCTQAVSQSLNCVSLHSSLAQLRDMKRPAILMLVDDAGTQRQVVLAGIGSDGAELQVGSRTVRVPISELSRYWYGDCVVLWRPARLPVYVLHPGMHGPAIHTLRTRLLQASGAEAGDEHSFSFDDELSQRVADFQRAHHLNVDGIAGIETQMLLDAVLAAPGTPVLQSLDKPSPDKPSPDKPATVAAAGAAS